jgi:predicted alpha/beta superfamily hydrolase
MRRNAPAALLLSALSICIGRAAGAEVKATPGAAAPLEYLPALAGGYFVIHSQATEGIYHIYVRLPQGYETEPTLRYPVVYVLDGDSLFPILAATHLFLTMDDKLPEAIVVGIAYGSFDPAINKRGIDFMPPDKDVPAKAAGAPAFLKFLKSELLPVVETKYRVDPTKRILFGQSRGGSFVLYSAFADPDLFWATIAGSPAIPPTRQFFYTTPALGKRQDLRLFVAEGSGDLPRLRVETIPWLAEWESRTDKPWSLTPILIRDGTHGANSGDAYRAAMRQLFDRHPQQ